MRVKFTLIDMLVLVMIAGVLAGLLLPSQDFDSTHRYPPAAHPIRVDPGLTLVAGEYYMGNGRGTSMSLSILPDGRYSFVDLGCVGVIRRESGTMRWSGDHYVLSTSESNKPPHERALVPVDWGRRRYLIPPRRREEFRDAIAEGKEPRDEDRGWFYVQLPIKPAVGLPDSPPEWAATLRAELSLGRVLDVGPAGHARVDLGTRNGLQVGDVLTVQRPGHAMDRRLRVVSVEGDSCVAEEPHPQSSPHPLKRGQAVVAPRFGTNEDR
jgi:hypothetical protein